MTKPEDAASLVQRMQQCFNTREFEQAAELHTLDFFSHPLGAAGFEAGKEAWRMVTARFPDMRVVAEDILVDGDKAAVRSIVEGIPTPEGDPQPMLFEIFRFRDGRFAEAWGASAGFPSAASPEDLASQPLAGAANHPG
jgi:hypothetical protein